MKIWIVKATWPEGTRRERERQVLAYCHYPRQFIGYLEATGATVEVKSTYWDLIPDSGEK